MSRYWPHTAYAEDQTFHHTILTTHVLHRGFQTGAALGIFAGSVRFLTLSRKSSVAASWPLFRVTLERSTGMGGLIGTGALAVLLTARMWGRQQIEWQDRSWRLMENQGQVEVDDWSLSGAALGVAAVVLRRQKGETLGWRRLTGGAGLGSIGVVLGHMGWTYAIKTWRKNEQ